MNLLNTFVPAATAVIVVIISSLVQYMQFRKNLQQKSKELEVQNRNFRENLALEWEKFQNENTTLELKTINWLDKVIPPNTKEIESPSPYIVGPPIIDPDDFFGRSDQVRKFYELVFGQQLTSVSILGCRKSGKTSFLNYVSHPKTIREKLGMDESIVPVYINLQIGLGSESDFYKYLAEKLFNTISLRSSNNISIPVLPNVMKWSLLDDIFSRLDKIGYQVLVFLDEFEQLTKSDIFKKDFFDRLRALAQNKKVAWITASYRELYRITEAHNANSYTSPFFNTFHPERIYLESFTISDALRLICHPIKKTKIKFDRTELRFILNLAGRMPFPIQVASLLLYENKLQSNRSQNLYKLTENKFHKVMKNHFQHYLLNFEEREIMIIKNFLQNPKAFDHEYHAADSLINYGFISKENKNYIIGQSFKNFLYNKLII